MIIDIAILILAAFANIFLGAVVLMRNPKKKEGQAFLAMSLAITLWSIANYLTDHAPSLPLNTIFAHLAFLFAFFTVVFIFLFTQTLSNLKTSRINILLTWLMVIGGGLLSASNYVTRDVVHHIDRSDTLPGDLYIVYISLVVGLFILSLFNLRAKYVGAGSNSLLRVQIKFITFGLTVSFFLILLTNALIPVLTGNWSVAKVGPLMTVFLVGSISYAIVKHRLFDIRLVVARSFTYLLLLSTLAGAYGAALFGASQLLFKNSVTSAPQTLTYIIMAVLLAFTFQPLRRFFEHITDRIFYRDRYDSQVVLNAVGKVMAEEIILERLLSESLTLVCQAMKIETGQFMIFEKNRIFKVEHYGPLPSKLMVVPTTAKLHHLMLVADELEGGERKKILDEHSVRVSLMLRTKDTMVGFLFLGNKLSGDIYTSQDLQLLQILVQELSIAILNAKAYAEIAQFNVTLQDKVNKATARLKVANRNLKALDSAKDEFISMASHQLRTPLTTIKGYLSMMIEGDTGPITGEQKEFVGYAYEGAERMVALISDLLNVSRLSAGRFVIDRKPTDIAAVVADEVRQLRRHAEVKNLELKFVSPKRKLPLIDLDEGKTRQVIMNFIDNAIYYTKSGGVYVNLTIEKNAVKLTVRDTGIGVPEVAKAHLFTKFFRAENAQAARPDGTGLGLYLAKQVIEDQGGGIIFESRQDHGSTFGFRLPVKVSQVALKVKTEKLMIKNLPVPSTKAAPNVNGQTSNRLPSARSGLKSHRPKVRLG